MKISKLLIGAASALAMTLSVAQAADDEVVDVVGVLEQWGAPGSAR